VIKAAGKPFNFMLARVRPNLRNNDGIAMALDALGLVVRNRMHERVIYAESFAHGKTAFEIDPKGIAAQELAGIWTAIKGRIQESEKTRNKENALERSPA
jgi:chromosome partitioning protein